MSEHRRHLEQQRLGLIVRSQKQRDQLISFGVAAGDAFRHLRMLLRVATSVAYLRRLRQRVGRR